jgi:hypothetical protein
MFSERSSPANMKSCRRFGSRNKSQDEEKNQTCDPHSSFGPSTLDQRGEDSSSSRSTASTAIAHAFEACFPLTHQIPNQPKPSGVLRPLRERERERARERSLMLTNPFFTYRVWCNLDASNLCAVMSEHSIFQSLLLLLQQLMIMICSWWWWWCWWSAAAAAYDDDIPRIKWWGKGEGPTLIVVGTVKTIPS